MTAAVHSLRPPLSSPATYREWLLADKQRIAAWLEDRLTPTQVVQEYPEITSSVQMLANWRSLARNGRKTTGGPPYLILPAGIRYRRLDLLMWMESRRVDPEEEVKRRKGL